MKREKIKNSLRNLNDNEDYKGVSGTDDYTLKTGRRLGNGKKKTKLQTNKNPRIENTFIEFEDLHKTEGGLKQFAQH